MAARKTKSEPELTETELDKGIEQLSDIPGTYDMRDALPLGRTGRAELPPPGIVKEYVQNGMRYQRVRTEKGELIDVRI